MGGAGPLRDLWWIQTRVEEVAEDEIEARMGQPEYLDDLTVAMRTLDEQLQSPQR